MFESLHSLFSMSSPKRYVINIDDAGSKLHLNPKYYDDMWCKLDQEKRLGFGGRREVTREEAIAYRSGKKSLIFNGKRIINLKDCKNCSNRCRQSVFWDIP